MKGKSFDFKLFFNEQLKTFCLSSYPYRTMSEISEIKRNVLSIHRKNNHSGHVSENVLNTHLYNEL